MEKKASLTVIIPTWHPDDRLVTLLKRLAAQTVTAQRILIVNTCDHPEDAQEVRELVARAGLHPSPEAAVPELVHIPKEQFDHGGTRDMAARLTDTDYLLFMTMDALPAHRSMIAALLRSFDDPMTVCAYARQIPGEDADPLETYTREFNYGRISRRKVLENREELGIKTYFCSNVCAMYRRDLYLKLGGFPQPVIFNEDMIFAGRAIQAGYSVYYQAQARVIHSHRYTGAQQFHRNFDLGVSQEQHPEVFKDVTSEGEGIRLVKRTAAWLTGHGLIHLVPKLVWQSGCKWAGYRLGRSWRRLPKRIVRKWTGNPGYWEQKPEEA